MADAVRAEGQHQIVGVVSETGSSPDGLPAELPVVASNGTYGALLSEIEAEGFVVALGDNAVRRRLQAEASTRLMPVSIIHPSAILSPSATVGLGTVVMAGCVVNAGARVGDGVIVNTRASIDHDSQIGDFAHLSPGVTLAGAVRIGEESWLGTGACVIPRITIGRNVRVAAGSVVTRDVPDGVRFTGGRILRET